MRRWMLISMLLFITITANSDDFSRKIAQVKNGTLKEARAIWWGFDKEDATKCLQEAINSGVKKLWVDNVGYDWIVGPIKVSSNLEIIFADGVVVRAKAGEFKNRSDCLFDISDRTNVTLRGKGKVRFVMNKDDYQNPELYTKGEHRHTINIYNSRNVLVQNLQLESSGGDGVYVGSGGQGEGSRNITLDRLICLNHYRQGISVTGVENLLIKNCQFNETSGTAPQCGIDYEPNYPEFSLVNCVAVNCEFNRNAEAGINLSLNKLDATSRPVSISFRNCRVTGNKIGIRIISTGSGTPVGSGKIEFVNCMIADNQYSVAISEHRVKNLSLIFKNTVIDNRKAKGEAMRISSGCSENITGLRIETLTVIDDMARQPIKFFSQFSNGLVDSAVTGVKMRNSTGKEISFDSKAFLKANAPFPFKTIPLGLKALKPLNNIGRAAGSNLRFREKNDYLLWANAGQKILIKFANKPVHYFEGSFYRSPLEVIVWNPCGTIADKFGIPFDDTVEYMFNATETGVYRFSIDARSQTVSIETDAPGQGFAADKPLYLFGCSGQLYFWVPAGVKKIMIEAGGVPLEPSSVVLLDAEGRQVDTGVEMEGSKVLQATREDVSKPEIWSIKFSAKKLFLRIGVPLVPIFFTDPDNALVPKPNDI